MRLMPPAQLQDKKATDLARDLLRVNELNEATDRARRELANAEANFKTTLANQRLSWAQNEEEHAKRVIEMDTEITALEKRKEQALIPISMYKQEANEFYKQAETTLALVHEKETRADDILEKLQDKLDSVGEREQDVLKLQSACDRRILGIEQQEQITGQRSTDLTEAYVKFNAQKAQAEKEIFAKQEDLIIKERTLMAKEEGLKRTGQALADWDKRLKDERGTLDRMYIRLKNPLSPLQKPETKA